MRGFLVVPCVQARSLVICRLNSTQCESSASCCFSPPDELLMGALSPFCAQLSSELLTESASLVPDSIHQRKKGETERCGWHCLLDSALGQSYLLDKSLIRSGNWGFCWWCYLLNCRHVSRSSKKEIEGRNRKWCGWKTAYIKMLVCRNRLAKVSHQTKVTSFDWISSVSESKFQWRLVSTCPKLHWP